MADRFLLESSDTDGYLLEDGSGVILLETLAERAADLSQTLGSVTVTATATNATDADLAQTLGAVSLAAEGDVVIAAAAANSLDAITVSSGAQSAIAAALTQTLGAVSLAATASSQEERTATLEQTLGDVTLSADATVPQPVSISSVLASVSSGGGRVKRARRKKGFTVFEVKKPVPPPISAGLQITLGDVGLSAAATMGELPAKRARRMAAAALLLH